MSARDHLRLGPDGKYIWVENPDDVQDGLGSEEIVDEEESVHLHQNLKTISSSISGPGIGDDVAAKRASLIHAQGKPQIGRRESPEPYDPRPTRIMYAKGIIAGLIVVLAVIAIIVFLGTDYSIA